jgi:hypothetical protein
MKPLFALGWIVAIGLAGAAGAEADKVTFYVQLIHGSNEAKPPVSGAKRVGPKLAETFRPVFNWTNYWEVSRQQVALARGEKTRIQLSKEREVEIDLRNPAKRKVTAYHAGQAVSRLTRPVDEAMTIIGGDRDTNSVWFIVVRRDKPTS